MRPKTPNEVEAVVKLIDSGLFTKEQLDSANTWFIDYPPKNEAFISPNKAGEVVGMAGRYVLQLCRDGAIKCTRSMMMGWWLIPAETVIELRKRVVDRQNGRTSRSR